MRKKLRNFISKIPILKSILSNAPRVSVVRLSGVLSPNQGGMPNRDTLNFENVESLLEDAYEAPNLKAVALIINSPGGTPAQAALIANKIVTLSKQNKVKTYAFIEDVAASGGYWIACAAHEIHVQPSSIIGSIGVVSAGFGFDAFIHKHGIQRRVYTAGDHKTMLDPFQKENPSDIKRLKDIQKQLHQQFIDWVKSCRGNKLNSTDKKLFNGDIWLGTQAIDLGLVDGLSDMKSLMQKKFGKNTKFMPFSMSKGFLSSLIGSKHRIPDDLLETLENHAKWNALLQR